MINWKLRLKNKATLASIIGLIVACVYQILGALGVSTPISDSVVIEVAGYALDALFFLGIIVDPTTSGVCDSTQAMCYAEPKEN